MRRPAWVALGGIGRGEIHGPWSWDGAHPVELRGATVLAARLPGTEGCYDITIDGASGETACYP